MLAAAYISLVVGENASYCPKLSIWDTEKRALISTTDLNVQKLGSCIFLINFIRFSDDGECLYGGGWQYNLKEEKMSLDKLSKMGNLKSSAAVIFSPDSRTALRLEPNGRRTLIGPQRGSKFTFTKPPYYEYEDDNPDNLTPGAALMGYHWRCKVAPFQWWQFWREVTRAYQFSPDSQWFARFTDQHAVILRNLISQTERIIYQPLETWNPILVNDIVFDVNSERLAWTFDHIGVGGGWNTRLERWSTRKMVSTGGFQFGRLWRQRIEFCTDPRYILSYRMGVIIWDIPSAIKLEESTDGRGGSEDWLIGQFAQSQHIRVGYSLDGIIFVNYREESKTNGLVTHIFRNDNGTGRKVSYRSPLQLHSKQQKFPPAWHENFLALGDTIFDLSGDSIVVFKSITIAKAGDEVICTAFHLASEQMACLQCSDNDTMEVQLYCTKKNQLVMFTTFTSGDNISHLSPEGKIFPGRVVFDPSPTPRYLVVLLSQRGLDEHQGEGLTDDDRTGADGTLYVWVFNLPSLHQTQSFRVCNYRYRALEFEWDSTLKCYFNSKLDRLICCEERKAAPCCQLWIIDLENEAGVAQFFPDFRQLDFVPQLDMVFGITVEGWIQCKMLCNMDSDISEHGNGSQMFKGRLDNWVLEGWKKLGCVPPNLLTNYESGIAVHPKGELAYISELSDRLIQISFQW